MPFSEHEDDNDDPEAYIEELIGTLQRAAATRGAVARDAVADAVDSLLQYASVHGLSSESLEAVVDVCKSTPCYIDQASIKRTINALLPRGKVPEDIVIKVVGSLGQGVTRPPLATQALLLRWLVMVYDVLEEYTTLSKLYGVLFNLLDMITLRPYLCPLLSQLTKRRHVKPFRIQALLELKRNVGNDLSLNSLLQVYKNYYPDVVPGDVGPLKRGMFSHPDPEWMQRLNAIQESSSRNKESTNTSGFKVSRRTNGRVAKKRRTERVIVPPVHTLQAVETSVTLEEVENVDDFAAKLDALELPNQIAAVLDDALLQKLLQLRPSDAATERLNDWLAGYLSDELRILNNAIPGTARESELFAKIARYTRFTGQMLPAVDNFLQRYLRIWDGKIYIDAVLSLVAHIPLRDFQGLRTAVFTPLETALSKCSAESQARLIDTYTEILRQWKMAYTKKSLRGTEFDDVTRTITAFLEHCNHLCLTVLQRTGRDPKVADAVLWFYEHASALPWENGCFRVSLPPDPLVYHFVFAGDSMMLSRLCGCLSRFKKAFELSYNSKKQPLGRDGEPIDYRREYVDHFNGFLMDICNCLWRNRAFGSGSKQDQNAMGCTLDSNVVAKLHDAAAARGQSIVSLFSLSHNTVLALLSTTCFRALENANQEGIRVRHAGPVTMKSLALLGKNGGLAISYSEFRVAVLNDLGRKGLIGIWDFMHNTMVSLIQSTATNARFSTRAPVRR